MTELIVFVKQMGTFLKKGLYFIIIIGCAGSSLLCTGLFQLCERASHCGGFSSCEAWALGHMNFRSCVSWASLPHGTWNLSWTRDHIYVSCISRWIFYHWTTREVPDGEGELKV